MDNASSERGGLPYRWEHLACLLVALFLMAGAYASARNERDGANGGAAFTSSFETGDPALLSAGTKGWHLSVVPGPGKEEPPTSKPGAGFSGTHALRYDAEAGGHQARRATLFRVHQQVMANTQLAYVVFPVRQGEGAQSPAQFVAVDLLFADGSRLSSLGAQDQHRVPASASAQGQARVLYDNQWNALVVDVGAVAA